MSAPKIRTDHDVLAAIAQRFDTEANDTRQTLQKLKSQMEVLQGGDWIGKGAQAFYREMNGDVLPALQRLINALEAARLSGRDPIFLYASTNKVYGGMEDVKLVEDRTRWRYAELEYGCAETQPLDFHSPYGCSKGTGDQYVRDYARMYGLRSVVFRQSCIYGQRQFGIEDQGWLAWMIIAAITGRKITIYGDGKQVRDVLNVSDLLNAYDAAADKIDIARGQVYNMGGGTRNILAIWAEFGPILENLLGKKIEVARDNWRPGDQRVFYVDYCKAKNDLGWEPKIDLETGIEMLFQWVQENKSLF